MSNNTFIISKSYVLSAIKQNGDRVYYDTDAHSGGYPYWSTIPTIAKRFKELDKIPTLKGTDYMRVDVIKFEVLEVECQATIISCSEIVSVVKATAMAEIAKIEKELACKIAALEGM